MRLTYSVNKSGGPPRPGMLPTPPMGGPPMMPMMGPPPHGMMPGGPGERPRRIPRLCCAEMNVLESLQKKQLNEFKAQHVRLM